MFCLGGALLWQQCPWMAALVAATRRVGGMVRRGSTVTTTVTRLWYRSGQKVGWWVAPSIVELYSLTVLREARLLHCSDSFWEVTET